MSRSWELRESPHRAYWTAEDGTKYTWNGADKQRIVSVTTVLGEDERLLRWSVNQALIAGEQAVADLFGDNTLRTITPVGFPQLAALTGLLGEQIKNAAGERGTLAHDYFAARLEGIDPIGTLPPYGLRAAIDTFFDDYRPAVVFDKHGLQIERAVGDYERAVAGTYDARLRTLYRSDGERIGRFDLKQSASLHGHHFAQLAAYERCAVLCGEEPSDYLALLHIKPTGDYRVVTIDVGSPEHQLALDYFDACLTRYRYVPRLDKLVAPPREDASA